MDDTFGLKVTFKLTLVYEFRGWRQEGKAPTEPQVAYLQPTGWFCLAHTNDGRHIIFALPVKDRLDPGPKYPILRNFALFPTTIHHHICLSERTCCIEEAVWGHSGLERASIGDAGAQEEISCLH